MDTEAPLELLKFGGRETRWVWTPLLCHETRVEALGVLLQPVPTGDQGETCGYGKPGEPTRDRLRADPQGWREEIQLNLTE
jgi:hypothetical protein